MKVKVSESALNCSFTEDMVCPFCGFRDEYSWECDIDESGEEVDCPCCGRTFIASAEKEIKYTTKPLGAGNTWKVGDYFDDGCKTQEDEYWCNENHYCEKENENGKRND